MKKLFRKFFVVLVLVSASLFSGCATTPSRPASNYVVSTINENPFPLRIIENGYTIQRCLLPGQTQISEMTVDDRRTDVSYRIFSFRKDQNTGKETIVATANFVLNVRGSRDSVIRRDFVVRYNGGIDLIVEEARGSSGSSWW